MDSELQVQVATTECMVDMTVLSPAHGARVIGRCAHPPGAPTPARGLRTGTPRTGTPRPAAPTHPRFGTLGHISPFANRADLLLNTRHEVPGRGSYFTDGTGHVNHVEATSGGGGGA